jgi:glycosyltransferase involved in cell wall biosynthesis
VRAAFIDQQGDVTGGAEQSLALLIEHLPRDIEPHAILFSDGAYAQRLRASGVSVSIVVPGKTVTSSTRERPRVDACFGLADAVARVASTLRRERIDVVHTNTVKAHMIGAPAARAVGIPCVVHLRDILDGVGRYALRTVARSFARERIAISSAVARCYDLPRTTVIGNPVALEAYTCLPERSSARALLGIPNDGLPLAAIVGRINRWKGQDRFLRIIARAAAEYPVRCAIVGEARFRDADFVPELERLRDECGLGERASFVSWVEDPRTIFAAIDLHCNCSDREPFGRTTLEAAAAGVPTIAFDDGGAVDLIEDGVSGRLIPADDEAAFARAVIDFARDPALRLRLGNAAGAMSKRFEASSHAARVGEVLRRCAA